MRMGDLYIHIGVKKADIRYIEAVFPEGTVHASGDGWNSWGDLPGVDTNDMSTYHVLIGPFGGTVLTDVIADYVLTTAKDLLVPMGGGIEQDNTMLCITDAENWEHNVTAYMANGETSYYEGS